MNISTSKLLNMKISPRKLMLVTNAISGLSVNEALKYLHFSRKRCSLDVSKCIISAVSNANSSKQNFNISSLNNVYVSSVVGKGRQLKRMRCRARGKSALILKRYSHLYVELHTNKIEV